MYIDNLDSSILLFKVSDISVRSSGTGAVYENAALWNVVRKTV